MLFLLLRNRTAIQVNRRKAPCRIIEWADRAHRHPIAFMLKCPWCRKKQWLRKKELYIGFDGSKNNYRCKSCKVGLAPKRKWGDPGYLAPAYGFAPKASGWRSIYCDHPYDPEQDQ